MRVPSAAHSRVTGPSRRPGAPRSHTTAGPPPTGTSCTGSTGLARDPVPARSPAGGCSRLVRPLGLAGLTPSPSAPPRGFTNHHRLCSDVARRGGHLKWSRHSRVTARGGGGGKGDQWNQTTHSISPKKAIPKPAPRSGRPSSGSPAHRSKSSPGRGAGSLNTGSPPLNSHVGVSKKLLLSPNGPLSVLRAGEEVSAKATPLRLAWLPMWPLGWGASDPDVPSAQTTLPFMWPQPAGLEGLGQACVSQKLSRRSRPTGAPLPSSVGPVPPTPRQPALQLRATSPACGTTYSSICTPRGPI